MSKIYIVTDTELGWDCVLGVFDDPKLAEDACYPEPSDEQFFRENGYLTSDGKIETYHIHCKKLNDRH